MLIGKMCTTVINNYPNAGITCNMSVVITIKSPNIVCGNKMCEPLHLVQ